MHAFKSKDFGLGIAKAIGGKKHSLTKLTRDKESDRFKIIYHCI